MGSLFRSEPMQLLQMYIQVDAARECLEELGKLGIVEFKDLNPDVSAFQRNFVNDVKRCDEMERKLRFFDAQVKAERQEAALLKLQREEQSLIGLEDPLAGTSDEVKQPINFDELEVKFEELEKEIQQMNTNQSMLNRNYNELIELRHVLQKDSTFFEEGSDFVEKQRETEEDASKPLVDRSGAEPQRSVRLGFITGVILRSDFITFERVLWRVLRGNLFMKHAEIEEPIKDPSSGQYHSKNVFIVFFQGERAQTKIKKVCESFNSNLYPIPETPRERRDLLGQVNGRIDDLQKVTEKTRRHRLEILSNIGRHLKEWREKITREKAVYHTMNLFNYDVGRKLLIAEGWAPHGSYETINAHFRQATEAAGALVPSFAKPIETREIPPTFFRTNKLTSVYQGLVEAYGIPQYREINPTVFTIITFPFLFAVMFGDLGHGFLMTAFAAYLIAKEKELGKTQLNELIKTCYDGRYMLLMMGVFSMYTGLLYNECFSVPINIFGSNWEFTKGANDTITVSIKEVGRAYEFGVDPSWKGSANALSYYNSLKMKLSVILGVSQMSLGIWLSLLNGIHFKKPVNIFCEFVPQILFLWSLFGYLVFLIFYKWTTDWLALGRDAPFLLNVMIYMFLSPFSLSEENKLFEGQLYVQWALIVIAVVCVPWMLFSKPYILKHQHQMHKMQNPASAVDDDHGHGGHEEEFDFGEIFVHQIIHTIEFVLGAISNTASYLRLWALSLAHAELSEVFWNRVLLQCYSFGGFWFAFVGFAIWAGCTIGVLMVMESLSSFLHALRLHWVEFQNKFYHGDGRKFFPFSFERILAGEEEQ